MGKDCRRNIDLQRFCNEHYYFADCRILVCGALGLLIKSHRRGYVLAVNKANPVQELSAAQIKDVFDEEITNWKELGGPDAEVKVFRLEDITSYFSEEELGAGYEKAPGASARSLPVIQASSLLFPPNL